MKWKLLYMVAALLSVLLFAGCGDKSAQPGDDALTQDAAGEHAEAVKIYKQKCISCHGTDLKGRMGPNTNLTKVAARLSTEQIEEQIRNGGNGMGAFEGKLEEEQINALVEWLAAKK